jgi:hypothetical protein
VRWFKPAVPSLKQIARLKQLHAKGRKHYIFYWGVLGWGLLTFLLKSSWRWYHLYRWHAPARGDLYESLLIELPLWLVAGYFFGASMWKNLEEELIRDIAAQT